MWHSDKAQVKCATISEWIAASSRRRTGRRGVGEAADQKRSGEREEAAEGNPCRHVLLLLMAPSYTVIVNNLHTCTTTKEWCMRSINS